MNSTTFTRRKSKLAAVSYEVRYSRRATNDLKDLYRSIVRRGGGTTTALAYVERIRLACERLSDFPERGTLRVGVRPGLRIIGFERRVTIAFLVAGHEVVIARIAYAGRDLTALRFDDGQSGDD